VRYHAVWVEHGNTAVCNGGRLVEPHVTTTVVSCCSPVVYFASILISWNIYSSVWNNDEFLMRNKVFTESGLIL